MRVRHTALLISVALVVAVFASDSTFARTAPDMWMESRFRTGCDPGPSSPPPPPEHLQTHFPSLEQEPLDAALAIDLATGAFDRPGILGAGFNLEHALWSCPAFRSVFRTEILDPFQPAIARVDSGLLPAAPANLTADALGPAVYESVLSSAPYADSWRFFKRLNRAGVHIVLGVWGGPAQFTDDGTRLGVLQPRHYDDYVDYVATVVDFLVRQQGIQLWATTIANEPDGGDGNQIPPSGLAYIAHRLVPRLAPLGVKLYGPDTTNADAALQYLPALLADPVIADNLAFVGFHQYTRSSDVGALVNYVNSRAPELPVIATEYTSFAFGDLDAGQEANAHQGFTLDITATLLSHYRQGVDGALYWDAVDYLQPGHDAITRWGVLRGPGEDFARRQWYYGLAQILPYLQPGAKVFADDLRGPDGLQTLAIRTASGTPVVFVVNQEFRPIDLSLSLYGADQASYPSLAMTLTDRTHHAERIGRVHLDDGVGRVEIGPRSIATLFPAGMGVQPEDES